MYEPVIDTWEGAYLMICLYYFKGASFSEKHYRLSSGEFEKKGIFLKKNWNIIKQIGIFF